MRVTQLTRLLACVAMVSMMAVAKQAAAQAVLLFDNFDSYTAGGNLSDAEPLWTLVGASASNLVADSPTLGDTVPPQSAPNFIYHGTTATRNQRIFSESGQPSSTLLIRYSFDFYDTNGAAGAYRQHSNLQNGDLALGAGTNDLVAMGLNNNQLNSANGGNRYMGRIVGYNPTTDTDPMLWDGTTGGAATEAGGASGSFFKLNDFIGSPLRSTGWHNLRVDITDSDANNITDYFFYVDGILSEQVMNVGTDASRRSYDVIRLGSGLSSTSNAATDNMKVETIVIAPPVGDDADFDADGDIDGADFLTWQQNVSISDGSANLADGDADDDGNVDGADLDIWETQFGTATVAAQSIPEPASLTLAGLAFVAGLAASRRRQ